MSFQKLTIVGNIGGDFLQKNVNGKNVINGSIGVSKSYIDKSGVKKSETTWFRVAKWSDRDMGGLVRYLVKGTMILVTGEVSARSYTDKDGKTQCELQVTADEIKLLSAKRETSPPQQQPQVDNNSGLSQSQQEFLVGGDVVDEAPF